MVGHFNTNLKKTVVNHTLNFVMNLWCTKRLYSKVIEFLFLLILIRLTYTPGMFGRPQPTPGYSLTVIFWTQTHQQGPSITLPTQTNHVV